MSPKRPNKFLYFLCGLLLRIFSFFKGQRFVKKIKIKGPALTLSNHSTWFDFAYTFNAIFPQMTTFVAAEKMFSDKFMGFWLKASKCIPKKLFRADPRATLSILKHLNAGHIVSIFPEGQISITGHQIPINYAIAKLIKKVKVDVYAIVHERASLVDPSWSKKSFKGKFFTHMDLILTKESIETMSEDDVYNVVCKSLDVNPDLKNEEYPRKYKGYNVKGLENIIYECDECGHLGLETIKNQLICPHCGQSKTYDFFGMLSGKTIHEAFYGQKDRLKNKVKNDPNYTLESPTILESYIGDKIGVLGEGTIKLNKDGFTYKGTFKGKDIEQFFPIEDITSLPGDLGNNIQIYYKDEYYQFKLPYYYEPAMYIIASELFYEMKTKHALIGVL